MSEPYNVIETLIKSEPSIPIETNYRNELMTEIET